VKWRRHVAQPIQTEGGIGILCFTQDTGNVYTTRRGDAVILVMSDPLPRWVCPVLNCHLLRHQTAQRVPTT
jgi:hypothetical protein